MKYTYARNSSGKLIHISEVNKNLTDKYSCIECNDGLIARLGDHNAHHFSHKVDCNYESYLHTLAKLRFNEYYTECLRTGSPFYIELEREKICMSCALVDNRMLNISCSFNEPETFDLTKYFKNIEIEKGFDGFVADILLSSDKVNEVVFIEIAVTHKCEAEKIESGNRIVEIEIKNEGEIASITKEGLSCQYNNLKYYNFKTKVKTGRFFSSHECNRSHRVFALTKKGKPVLADITVHRMLKYIHNEDINHVSFLNKDELNLSKSRYLAQKIKQLYSEGIEIRRCLLCKHSELIGGIGKDSNRLFCDFHYKKLETRSSDIFTDCKQFDQESQPTREENYLRKSTIQDDLDFFKKDGAILVTQEMIDQRRRDFKAYYYHRRAGYHFIPIDIGKSEKNFVQEFVSCPQKTAESHNSFEVGTSHVLLEDCVKCELHIGKNIIETDTIVCRFGSNGRS